MTIETDRLREDFRELMKSFPAGLPEYSADPIVQRHIGRLLATYGTSQPVWAAIGDLPPNNGSEMERAGNMALRAPRR